MQFPRWFSVFSLFLAVNVALVLGTSVWHLASATETTAAQKEPSTHPLDTTPSDDDPPELPSGAGEDLPELPAPQLAEQDPLEAPGDDGSLQLSELPVPVTLPEVPSLADPESLANDPIFQEFQKMFGAKQETSELASLGSENALGSTGRPYSEQYFASLESRLAAVRQITEAAQGVAAEAAAWSRRHEPEKARRFLKMSAQLREIAAELLISEL